MQKLSVSSLVRYLKNKLDTDSNLQKVLVSGEISNYHKHSSGHLYFTLKDEYCAISCVMFRSNASLLNFEPKTGDKVIITANTSIFETTGQLQLYVTKISLDGLGDLYARYEALKNKLNNEGYFDENNKIELSKKYLDNVAVLVGDKSAAMSDIKTTFARRWPLCNVDYYPVLVQGNDAPKQIINMLKSIDKLNYDAIILARGGGSFEDLFCFNDEQLVKCIYSLKTFIITGIGHEKDFTLADFVADKRAATPTATVELITPNIIDVLQTIEDHEQVIKNSLQNIFNKRIEKYEYLNSKLLSYKLKLNNILIRIDNLSNSISSIMSLKFDNYKHLLKRNEVLLNAYSSENTLKRGYTLVLQNNKIIKKKNELKNEIFEIKFFDGNIKAKEI